MKWKSWHLSTKLTVVYSLLIILVSTTLILNLYFELRTTQREALRERLVDILNFSAPLIDGEFHMMIRYPEDSTGDFYRVIRSRLVGLRSTTGVIQRIYTVRQQSNGQMVYVVDVGPTPTAGVGQAFARPAVLSGDLASLQYPVIEDEITVTRSGSYLRGFIPVYGQMGQMDGLLAVEIDAGSIVDKETEARRNAVLIFTITVPLAMALGWKIVERMLRPLHDLVQGVDRVSQGELEEKVPVRSQDEIGQLAVTFNAMTIQLRQSMAALKHREAHFRTLIENSTDIILVINPELEISYISPSVQKLLGYEWVASYVFDATEFVHPEDLPHVQKAMSIMLQRYPGSKNAVVRLRVRHQRGTWRVFECRFTNMLNDPVVEGIVINARDITDREQREQELQSIVASAAALRASSTRSEMLQVVSDQVTRLMQVDGVSIVLRNPTTGDMVCEKADGAWTAWQGDVLPANTGITAQVILAGRPYVNSDVLRDQNLARQDLIGNLRTVACIPLTSQERTIGSLWVGRRHVEGAPLPLEFNESEQRLLLTLGDIAANSIHRATLYEQTERRLQRLTALHTIDAAITTSTDLNAALTVVLNQVISQLKVHAADILRYYPHQHTLEFVEGIGFHSNLRLRSDRRLDESLPGQVVKQGRIYTSADLAELNHPYLLTNPLGEEQFVSYYGVPLKSKGLVKGVLEVFHRQELNPDPEWLVFLDTLAGQAAIAIDNFELLQDLQRSNTELELAYDKTLEGWSRALDLRDNETEGHTRRVAAMTMELARAMGMSDSDLVHVWRGALLHDIGKMGIPDDILLNPGPLQGEDLAAMHRHPEYAYDMLSPIPYLRPALDIPYLHHERWDGSGYPRGIKGEQIPLAVRIFSVVDVWDALTSDRPYRKAWTQDEARTYISEQSGVQFDPEVVKVFLKVF